ncbi:hypothetical protein DITRI_Ditri13aG0047300 [Diplodiscus trichospermus]
MRKLSETQEKNGDAAAFAIWDCGSPLYDSYELVSLCHLIERHLMKLPSLGCSKRLTSGRFSHPSDVTLATTTADPTSIAARAKEPSSLMHSLGEFLGRKLWKRRRFGQRRDKPKKLRTGTGCFCKK